MPNKINPYFELKNSFESNIWYRAKIFKGIVDIKAICTYLLMKKPSAFCGRLSFLSILHLIEFAGSTVIRKK
jgi:hypothetical protein